MTIFLHLTKCSCLLVFSTMTALALDLREANPSVMARLEILDQGKFDSSYAFVGAFLIDYKRFSNNSQLNLRTSPYSIANSYAKSIGLLSAMRGEAVCGGVNAAAAAGKLKAYNESSVDETYDIVGHAFHSNFVSKLMTDYEPLKRGTKFPIMTKDQFKSQKLRDKKQEILFTKFSQVYEEFSSRMSHKYYVPLGYQPSPEEAFFTLQEAHINGTWSSLAQTFIGLIIDKTILDLVSIPKGNCVEQTIQSEGLPKIKIELESKRPVGASVCSSLITGKHEKSCDIHHVAIIGLKQISGENYYLLRNSMGVNYQHDPRWLYDNGDLWIPARTMSKNIYQIHTYQ